MQQLLGVEEELLHPQGRPLADGGDLRRLEVRVSKAGDVAVATRQLGERDEDGGDAAEQELEALVHEDQVGVVRDVRARRSEVDVRTGRRRLLAEVMDVGHDIVAQPLLVLGGALEVGVVDVLAHLRQRVLGDVETELFLGLHQCEPEPPPQPDAPPLSPQRLHRRGGIPLGQGRAVRQTGAFARPTSLFQSARN